MKSRRKLWIAAVGALIALGFVVPVVQVCRDWAFFDRHSGSRKGYREWAFGWRSGSWYRESALESFMRSNYPAEFRQEWVSYAGTGRTILGGSTVKGHGRPGGILSLKPEVIDEYCRTATDIEKRRLHDVLASGDQSKIGELVEQVIMRDWGRDEAGPTGAISEGLSDQSNAVP